MSVGLPREDELMPLKKRVQIRWTLALVALAGVGFWGVFPSSVSGFVASIGVIIYMGLVVYEYVFLEGRK